MKRLFLAAFVILAAKAGAQATASPQVRTFTIKAPQLETSKRIWLYLPQTYASSDKKYPVLYMHDAQNLFDKSTSFAGEWRVDETLDSLRAQAVVVGIEHGNEKRMDELTPYANVKYGGGKADAYLAFIVETLKPHIDSVYRTKPDAKHTAIMGSSLGGLVSFYAALKYPAVFGKAGIFSPSFWFSKEIYAYAERTPEVASKLYFLCGDDESDDIDMAADVDEMYDIISRKVKNPKKQLCKKVIKGGKHNEKLWRENFADAYLWLFK
jgi:predicted alpha/beta superfamily hydrolase